MNWVGLNEIASTGGVCSFKYTSPLHGSQYGLGDPLCCVNMEYGVFIGIGNLPGSLTRHVEREF